MSFDELPEVLTVEEAGAFLRISRGLAYELARQFVATNGAHGLPVVKLGRRLIVPKRQLELLLGGDLAPVEANNPLVRQRTPARTRSRSTADSQLTLLPLDASKQA